MSKPASLVALLLGAYGIIVQLFPMLVGALWWKQASTKAAVYGLVVGSVLTITFQLSDLNVPWGFDPGFFGLIINAIIFVVVSKISPTSQIPKTTLATYE